LFAVIKVLLFIFWDFVKKCLGLIIEFKNKIDRIYEMVAEEKKILKCVLGTFKVWK